MFNQFPDYQSLEKGAEGAPAKANRSIPDRIEYYGLMKYLNKGSKVLDLGCNRGYFGTVLSDKIHSYHGMDSDQSQLNHAIIKSNMSLQHGSFTEPIGRYNVIFSFAFHSYVGMSMKAYAKCLYDMCEPEGYLFIEGHPPGYRGEPNDHFIPLKEHLSKHFTILEEKEVKDRELKRPFIIYQKMTGMVSWCERIGDIIEKHYYDQTIPQYLERGIIQHWKKELIALKTLKGQKHVPQLISAENNIIKMSWCGDRLNKDNLPKNWKAQCKKIDALQKKFGIIHMDVKLKNITVKNGTIYLLDWGLWTNDKSKFQPIEKVLTF